MPSMQRGGEDIVNRFVLRRWVNEGFADPASPVAGVESGSEGRISRRYV